ncbi:hypothetical protein P3342_001632 [Pyrenophora teres f. teres]|uniref:Uncharacterized protein n=1 Tax=Pyrenophora teres f. teres TaxID=97479 RepID=A0A6S6VES3_9PLEO|nr:hypothetical protein PTNB85_09257 [Pyrenophora teres f. teres]KAE8854863.1 hypothetical protein PTNB73_10293 [Pyrenophora teres f. teres]KAK1917050.1 hypothetical protein P3342_001632 [Pyrenophora teres f. teres]CAE7002629.1 hypothetical protein PTTW11_01417 [Pyrenophora teres f. teres]
MESATGPEPTEVKMKSYAGRYRNKASSCHVMIEVDKEQLILTDETCPTQSKRYVLARCKPTNEVGRATSLWVALPDNTNSSPDKKHAADEDQPTGNHINYILTADDKIIHIPERSGRLRIATCGVVPYADANSAFDIGYRPRLPEPFNQLQFVSKKIFDLARGRELTINHLKVNGWNFDNFRRLDTVPPASASEWFVKGAHWFDSVRKVTLLGQFGVGRTADENVLHSIIRFGHEHPKAEISVSVHVLSIQGKQRLDGFMTVAWLIQEAVRGILRPTWVAPKDKLVQSWRRGKDVDFMNAKNVRFKPSDEYDWQKVKTPATKTKKVPTIIRVLNEFGSLNEMVAFVKNIYNQGI